MMSPLVPARSSMALPMPTPAHRWPADARIPRGYRCQLIRDQVPIRSPIPQLRYPTNLSGVGRCSTGVIASYSNVVDTDDRAETHVALTECPYDDSSRYPSLSGARTAEASVSASHSLELTP